MVLISMPFGVILEVDNWLYAGALLLEYAAFIQLRRAKTDMPRPFKVPGGMVGAVLMVLPPFILGLYAMAICAWQTQVAAFTVIICGIASYYLFQAAKAKH